jgi:hypothetical protein
LFYIMYKITLILFSLNIKLNTYSFPANEFIMRYIK